MLWYNPVMFNTQGKATMAASVKKSTVAKKAAAQKTAQTKPVATDKKQGAKAMPKATLKTSKKTAEPKVVKAVLKIKPIGKVGVAEKAAPKAKPKKAIKKIKTPSVAKLTRQREKLLLQLAAVLKRRDKDVATQDAIIDLAEGKRSSAIRAARAMERKLMKSVRLIDDLMAVA